MRIGIDLGGTKIEAIALDAAGKELRRVRVATPKGEYEGTVNAIRDLALDMEAELGESGTVGVGIPGTVTAATGLVKNANSIWLNGMPFERDLSTALNREVRCANDANCFTVSEATDGAAKGYHAVFGVIMGTGCGGGISIDGRVHAGPNGLAGEWGHTPLPWMTGEEFPGPACYCGKQGCLETWISGTGLEWDYARATSSNLRGSAIVAAAAAGEPAAQASLQRLISRVARGLSTIVNVFDPDIIVLGGGLSNLDRLYDGELSRLLSDASFGGGVTTPIVKNVHGDSSGVRGAAWLWPEPETAKH
ncbi:ROK family protein [Granulicella paludicola]|uniref:ROK family protein n=1 Tax=Granulicella paludicola TaxID=474951 RepID=UPI0021DF5ED3|nr:ROK family protein [Granulicella paludicola]